ncbi:MAG: hypothetical protein LBM98_02635 [Oscillospiraceae bacterium]|nr:hypothetical protein [Oscillospiraceae bacterium]
MPRTARGRGASPSPSLRAAESIRYVPLKPARQSSAAVHRYVCYAPGIYVSYAPGTGLLRA